MPERSKKNFGSARSAWMNIAKDTGLKPSKVKSAHTKTKWIWIVK